MAFTASLYYHLDGTQYLHYSLLHKIKQSANKDLENPLGFSVPLITTYYSYFLNCAKIASRCVIYILNNPAMTF